MRLFYVPSLIPVTNSVSLYLILGKYCALSELSAESGLCDAGFYCSGGSSVPNPQNKEMGGVCPLGHFCGAGTSSPSPCPPGQEVGVKAL